MPDKELIEPFPAFDVFVDGFTEHVVKDGVMRCIGYRIEGDRKIVVVRLRWPEHSTQAAIDEAIMATGTAPLPTPRPMRRKVH